MAPPTSTKGERSWDSHGQHAVGDPDGARRTLMPTSSAIRTLARCSTWSRNFEVTPSDPKYGRVVMTMSVKLDGHLRTDINGGASLRIASATVQPAGGGERHWGSLSLPVRRAACRVHGGSRRKPSQLPRSCLLDGSSWWRISWSRRRPTTFPKATVRLTSPRFPRASMGLTRPSRKGGHQGLRPQRHPQGRHALKDRTGKPPLGVCLFITL